MFPLPLIGNAASRDAKPPLNLYNTLTRSKERFEPLKNDFVRLYNCGPTVYDYAHIGNLRAYVFADMVRRTLVLNGYKVKQVMNITDVGHLTSDADQGEDKMTVGLTREGLPLSLEGMHTLADRYTAAFLEDMEALLVKRPTHLPRASEHIPAMIALISTLVEKEYAYRTSHGVYFDTARFPEYGKLGQIQLDAQQEGARVAVDHEKRSIADFALWKRNDELGWESPWGRGFPGWHIECSAMSMQYLGKQLDIHTGGVDHIGTHHNNEIAQSEAATGKPFSRFWLHSEHLHIEGSRIAKSAGNGVKLRQLTEHGYQPLAYRYWLLTGHYRSQLNFSFSSLDAAQTAWLRLHRMFVDEYLEEKRGRIDEGYREKLLLALNDDLNTAKAIALMWDLVKDASVPPHRKRATLLHFDKVLGLGLHERVTQKPGVPLALTPARSELPAEIQMLVDEREAARAARDFAKADTLRTELGAKGFTVEDTQDGPRVTKTETRV